MVKWYKVTNKNPMEDDKVVMGYSTSYQYVIRFGVIALDGNKRFLWNKIDEDEFIPLDRFEFWTYAVNLNFPGD